MFCILFLKPHVEEAEISRRTRDGKTANSNIQGKPNYITILNDTSKTEPASLNSLTVAIQEILKSFLRFFQECMQWVG